MALVDYRFPLDEPIFHAVNEGGFGWLDRLWVLLSSLQFGLSALAVLALVVAIRWRKRAHLGLAQLALAVAATDSLVGQVLKPLFGRLRPSFALAAAGTTHVLAPTANSGSMPSGHAANAFAVATVVTLMVPGAGRFVFPLATLIALSRIGCGVHWPTDIFGGALLGATIGASIAWGGRRLFPG
jgi:undecaprenyl-diphosphatase